MSYKSHALYVVTLAMIPIAFQIGRNSSAEGNRVVERAAVPSAAVMPSNPTRAAVAAAPAGYDGPKASGLDAAGEFLTALGDILSDEASPQRDKRMGELFRKLGANEGVLAFQQIGGLSGRLRELAITSILLGWSSVDSQGAWNWAAKEAVSSGHEWVDSPSPANAGKLMMLVSSLYREGNGASLPTLIESLPEGGGKNMIVGLYSKMLTQYSPEKALSYIQSLEGMTRTIAVRNAATDMAREAPVQTAEWVLKLPPHEGEQAIKPVVTEWLSSRGSEVAAWLKQQKQSTVLDKAIDQFIGQASLDLLRSNGDLLQYYSSSKSREVGVAQLSRRLDAIERSQGIGKTGK